MKIGEAWRWAVVVCAAAIMPWLLVPSPAAEREAPLITEPEVDPLLELTPILMTLPSGERVRALTFFTDSAHNYVVEFRDGSAVDPCTAWQPLPDAPHNYGIVYDDDQHAQRDFRLRRIDQPSGPLFGLLARDTGPDSRDTLTSDATITGLALQFPLGTVLEAALDEASGPFSSVIDLGDPKHFLIRPDQLEQIAGGTLTDGRHTLYLRATHPSQGQQAAFQLTFQLDTIPPTLSMDLADTFDSSPGGDARTGVNPVILRGITTPGLELELQPGGLKTTADATGEFTFSDLELVPGPNEFTVRTQDLACNKASITRSFILLDTEPPDTTITAHPPALSTTDSAKFTFAGSDQVTVPAELRFECRLDDGAFLPCLSSQKFSGLADGSHTFVVRAIDSAGNVDDTPASFTWQVDTNPPDTVITSHPPALSTTGSAKFTFTGTDKVTAPPDLKFEYRVDGGPFLPCTSSQRLAGLTDGSHTLEVRAIDTVGHADPTPASFTWMVDAAPPDTQISSHPLELSTTGSAKFTFTGTDNLTAPTALKFEYRLDAGAFTASLDAQRLGGLGDGPHTLDVRARDTAGNVDATPARFTWTVDTTAPETRISTHPPELSPTDAAKFSFSGADNITTAANLKFEYRLDGGAFKASLDSQKLAGLANGSHTLEVRAIDTAGHVNPTPASFTWKVDTTINSRQSPFSLIKNFAGIDGLADCALPIDIGPPDAVGAIGSQHYIQIVRSCVRVFNRDTATEIATLPLNDFFSLTTNGVTYPRNGAVNPRILYDAAKKRWLACTMEFNYRANNQVILAVSKSEDPIEAAAPGWQDTLWDKYVIPMGEPDKLTDYPTLGTDSQGIFIGANLVGTPNVSKVAIIPKESFLTNAANTIVYYRTSPYFSMQPALNFDPVAANGRSWIVGGSLACGSLRWSDGVPAATINWTLDESLIESLPTPLIGLIAPNLGYEPGIRLDLVGTRPSPAVVRSNFLWTCRTVWRYDSTLTGRSGAQWIRFDLRTASPTVAETGLVIDRSSSNPQFHYFPSLMVNARLDVVMGFSRSSAVEYIGAALTGRLATDAAGTMRLETLLKAGAGPYGNQQLGNYSATSLDPRDDLTFWTVQQYAKTPTSDLPAIWGTWIGSVSP